MALMGALPTGCSTTHPGRKENGGLRLGFIESCSTREAQVVIESWLLDYTALGRRILFVGRGREVARLSGINTDRIRIGCLVLSGLLGALAGMLYAGTQGAVDPVSGTSYQLPAFAAAFLGSTSIVPGRFNPWGSTVAVSSS